MPIRYVVDRELRLVICVHAGEIDDQEVVSTYQGFLQDPEVKPDFTFVVDLAESVSVSRSSGVIRYLAKQGESWREGSSDGKRVAVITPADLTYGLARMFKAYADESDSRYRLFRSAEEAMEWVGRPMSVLENARSSLFP